MRVSVLVPAFNEAEFIPVTLDSLRESLPGAELIVIDDGSSDNTADLARAKGAQVIRHDRNRGKACALTSGLEKCTGEIVAMVDGDMGPYAAEIVPLVVAVTGGQCDLAIAVFSRSQGGGLGLVRNLARWGIFFLTGTWLAAPLSGQRAATRTLMNKCLPRRGGFGLETEFTLRALRGGYRVQEISTGFVHRGHGWTGAGVCHRGRQFFQVLLALFRGCRPWPN
jgi:glycosyltransferase involved in cell wall biosynthesis